MLQFPRIPSWDAVHPLVVHFPIALLLIAPLFLAVALLASPARARLFMVSALLMMILGTVSVYFAAATGKAAAERAESRPQVAAIIERHEHLAEETQVAFTILTLLLAGIVMVPPIFKFHPRRISSVIASVVVLAIYVGPAILLINTAHDGGLLVHQFGVTANSTMDRAGLNIPGQQLGNQIDRD